MVYNFASGIVVTLVVCLGWYIKFSPVYGPTVLRTHCPTVTDVTNELDFVGKPRGFFVGHVPLPDYGAVKSFDIRVASWAKSLNSGAPCHPTITLKCGETGRRWDCGRMIPTLRFTARNVQTIAATKRSVNRGGKEVCDVHVLPDEGGCQNPRSNPVSVQWTVTMIPRWHWTDAFPRWMAELYYRARHLMGFDTPAHLMGFDTPTHMGHYATGKAEHARLDREHRHMFAQEFVISELAKEEEEEKKNKKKKNKE